MNTGALTREFFTDAISDMTKLMFPNGSPVPISNTLNKYRKSY